MEVAMKIVYSIQKLDNSILVAIKKYIQNKYLDKAMPIITGMGNMGIIWFVIALALMLDKPYREIGNIVVLTLIISTIVGEGIVKHIVRRARPCNFYNNFNLLIEKPLSYSFPSGHTLSSFAVAEVLSKYWSQYKFIFIGIALLIALSRLYLYVHYPTDVIAGIVIGILCSKLVFMILQRDYITKLIVFGQNSL